MSPRIPFAVAAAAILLSACGFPDPKVEVARAYPIEMTYREAKGGLVLLKGRVNDREDVEFILDTGAPVSVLIDGPRTAKLGFDTSGAKPLGDPSNPAVPIGIIQPGVKVALDGVTFTGMSAVVVPLRTMPCRERFEEVGFAGVIGADLFRKFVVEVDTQAKRIRLHDPATWKPAPSDSLMPVRFHGGHPFVDVKVTLESGVEVTESMNLDIGMNRALTLVAGSHPAIVLPPEGASRKSCYVGGTRDERDGAPVDVTLGGRTIRVEKPNVSAHRNAVNDQRGGSLGATLFQGRRLTIDYPGKRIAMN